MIRLLIILNMPDQMQTMKRSIKLQNWKCKDFIDTLDNG